MGHQIDLDELASALARIVCEKPWYRYSVYPRADPVSIHKWQEDRSARVSTGVTGDNIEYVCVDLEGKKDVGICFYFRKDRGHKMVCNNNGVIIVNECLCGCGAIVATLVAKHDIGLAIDLNRFHALENMNVCAVSATLMSLVCGVNNGS